MCSPLRPLPSTFDEHDAIILGAGIFIRHSHFCVVSMRAPPINMHALPIPNTQPTKHMSSKRMCPFWGSPKYGHKAETASRSPRIGYIYTYTFRSEHHIRIVRNMFFSSGRLGLSYCFIHIVLGDADSITAAYSVFHVDP